LRLTFPLVLPGPEAPPGRLQAVWRSTPRLSAASVSRPSMRWPYLSRSHRLVAGGEAASQAA